MEVDLGTIALLLLTLTGVASGTASVALVKRFSNMEGARKEVKRIIACLLEFRLFADEPAVILRAQWNLLAANARLMRCVAAPSLALLIPYWLLLGATNSYFGHAPLQPGASSVVTLQCRHPADITVARIRLDAPAGLVVETPPVRIPAEAQICWRIRAQAPVAGFLRVNYDGRVITKRVSSAAGLQFLSGFRGGTLGSFLLHPEESPILDPAVQSIYFAYPRATMLDLPWLFWFSMASLVGALVGVMLC